MSDTETKKDAYSPLDSVLSVDHGSWADEEAEPDQPVEAPAPKKNAWGKLEQVAAISISEELNKKPTGRGRGRGRKETKGRNQQAREKQDDDFGRSDDGFQRRGGNQEDRGGRWGGRNYGRGGDRDERSGDFGGGDYGRGSRAPREDAPFPTSPPYTAYVGNLKYEVTEDDLYNFFGELGIASDNGIRIMKEDGKSRGYAYIDFEGPEGLEKALMSNNHPFEGRNMSVKIESKRRTQSSWGPSGGQSSYGSGRSSGRYGGRFSRDAPRDGPTERPKINVLPKSTDPQSTSTEEPHRRGEDPFGGPVDFDRLDRAAKAREDLEKERESKKLAEVRAREDRRPPREDREWDRGRGRGRGRGRDTEDSEIDTKSSWRSFTTGGSTNTPTRGGRAARGGQDREYRDNRDYRDRDNRDYRDRDYRENNRPVEEGSGGRGRGRSSTEDRNRGKVSSGQGDYYTGGGRGEKRYAVPNPHRPSQDIHSDKAERPKQAHEREQATTNPYAALAADEDEDSETNEEENSK